jgi:hypothetical protein
VLVAMQDSTKKPSIKKGLYQNLSIPSLRGRKPEAIYAFCYGLLRAFALAMTKNVAFDTAS